MVSPSIIHAFNEQLAVVFDDYFDTLGGGERSALSYAKSLMQLGFKTEVVTRGKIPKRSRIAEVFGSELAEIPIHRTKARNIYNYLKPSGLMVFVNHTFQSFEPNPARVGLYSLMFPVSSVRQYSETSEWRALQTYSAVLCNSSFTLNYARERWDYPENKMSVLLPPIGNELFRKAEKYLASKPRKLKQILNLGRFNPGVHNKNQKLIIECFLQAKKLFKDLDDWKLILCGNKNSDNTSLCYLNDCLELAKKSVGTIEIITDVSSERLNRLLEESFGYVHGTGAFIPPGIDPENCEHFGLAIAEAMANGCIPLVYARGGIFDILHPQKGAIVYQDRITMIEGFVKVARLFNEEIADQMQNCNYLSLERVSHDHFMRELFTTIQGELTRC